MDRKGALQRVGLVCVTLTILLMGLGAWVKANGAGLSCPDWPACYGKYLPPFPSLENGGTWHGELVLYTQAQELYEWAHRAVVSLLFVPLLVFALLAYRTPTAPRALRILPSAALGLYVFQAFLGYVTVATKNPPWATTAHLVTATLFLTTQVVATSAAFFAPFNAPSASKSASASVVVSSGPAGFVEARRFSGYTWPEATAPSAEPSTAPESVAIPNPSRPPRAPGRTPTAQRPGK